MAENVDLWQRKGDASVAKRIQTVIDLQSPTQFDEMLKDGEPLTCEEAESVLATFTTVSISGH